MTVHSGFRPVHHLARWTRDGWYLVGFLVTVKTAVHVEAFGAGWAGVSHPFFNLYLFHMDVQLKLGPPPPYPSRPP